MFWLLFCCRQDQSTPSKFHTGLGLATVILCSFRARLLDSITVRSRDFIPFSSLHLSPAHFRHFQSFLCHRSMILLIGAWCCSWPSLLCFFFWRCLNYLSFVVYGILSIFSGIFITCTLLLRSLYIWVLTTFHTYPSMQQCFLTASERFGQGPEVFWNNVFIIA